jgi:alkylation response protein AidB-like acyl-CoA dehydrogenase
MEHTDRPTTEDRTMFRDSLRGFLAEIWPTESAVAWGADPEKLGNVMGGLAHQGITTLGCDPASGGMAEIVVAMEELGRAACHAPVLAPILLNLAGKKNASLQNQIAALQVQWHMGDGGLSIAFGSEDPDRAAGAVTFDDGRVNGSVNFVEGVACTSHLAIAVSDRTLAIVATADPGVTFCASSMMDLPGSYVVNLSRAEATYLELGANVMNELVALARLAYSARALGAANRAFELVVEYAKERAQFGKVIGSFQAIQHKLASCHITLQAISLSIENAALQFDANSPDWPWYAAAATGLANSSLRQVSLETHHAFGAIGYSEEHEAPRHFRGVHLDVLRHGAARKGHEEVAAHFLDKARDFPVYDLGGAGNALRIEVRDWLTQFWSGDRKRSHEALPFKTREYDPDFASRLGATGWIGLSWPKRFGGQERSTLEQLAFIEEMERADAPRVGAPVQAVMLQVFGTAAQQAQYLPEILRGEAMFGMGYSEPHAGSDLASLKTRAVRDGDHYVINGQKIWTTTYWGKYMLLAARTRPDAQPPHAGISMFIVPMSTPGITVRTSFTMYGGTFANVFYDDVRVSADAMIGKEGDGWKVLTGALATERGLVGGGIVLKLVHLFELLCSHIRQARGHGRPLLEDPIIRARIGELGSQIEAGRQLMLGCAKALDQGNMDLADAAVSKVYSSELMERFAECALEILGMEGAISHGSDGAILNGRIEQNLRHSLMWVISIGTNEIQRNLIAQRGLGLPR